jgi:hypothetical protein
MCRLFEDVEQDPAQVNGAIEAEEHVGRPATALVAEAGHLEAAHFVAVCQLVTMAILAIMDEVLIAVPPYPDGNLIHHWRVGRRGRSKS